MKASEQLSSANAEVIELMHQCREIAGDQTDDRDFKNCMGDLSLFAVTREKFVAGQEGER